MNLIQEPTTTLFNEFEMSFEKSYDYNVPFEVYYDNPEYGLDARLELCYEATRLKLGVTETLAESVQKYGESDDPYYFIQSVIGDDENTTSNLPVLGPCLVGFGEVTSGIRISWKDCGMSDVISNYAEGWILTPPNREASFEATNRRHKSVAVPFTLDAVKMKNLSPVRKQSMLWELDLESKITSIAKVANWSDTSWFTYDYHQMALILATCIFDFEDAVKFPYLYGTEGGCGGHPPYGNLDSVFSALHYYNRGRAKVGALGLMRESYLINTGKMAPSESFFIKAAHIAQMGSKMWINYESAYRTLLERGNLSATEALDLLRIESGTELPDEILRLGSVVKPLSFIEGHSISILRDRGYILSELDVKVLLDAKAREKALVGDIPYHDVLIEQDEKQKLFRSKFMKTISEIVSGSPEIKKRLQEVIGELPHDYTAEFKDILSQYYELRGETYTKFSSFRYSDEIRIFKKLEIEAAIKDSRDELYHDMFVERRPEYDRRQFEENYSSKETYKELDLWFDSAPINELLTKPAPPGLGIDDYRIVTNTLDVLNRVEPGSYNILVIILFSGDYDLARILKRVAGDAVKKKTTLVTIKPTQYVSLCMQSLGKRNVLRLHEVNFYNYLTERQENFPISVLEQIQFASGLDRSYFDRALFHVEYDYPNLEKYLENYQLDARTRVLLENSGGFLQRRTLEGWKDQDYSWASMSYRTIAELSDFTLKRDRAELRGFNYLITSRDIVSDPDVPGLWSRTDYRTKLIGTEVGK